jgi:hypothetical protein
LRRAPCMDQGWRVTWRAAWSRAGSTGGDRNCFARGAAEQAQKFGS